MTRLRFRSIRCIAVLGIAVALLAGTFPAGAAQDDDDGLDTFRPDQAIVRLRAGSDVRAFNTRNDTRLIAAFVSRDIYLLRLPPAANEPTYLRTLQGDPATVWAELNFTNQTPEGRPHRFFLRGQPVPGGPEESYAPALIGVDEANGCGTGRGAIVAVIDSGIAADHPAFAGRLVPGWNVLTNTANVADVGDGRDNDGDRLVDEMTGHGTHVAGIVAQVAPGAKILPIKALDSDGVGDAFYLARGVFLAVDRGAEVINLSLGSTRNARVVVEAVAEARGAGILVTAAAGNENREEPLEYPAAGGVALGVASTDRDDRKSDFSNYHERVGISAPGTTIVSAYPGGGYVVWNGTSMATPWVSGTAALLMGRHPDWTPAQVVNRLAATAVDLDANNPLYVEMLGAGRLDAAAAICGA